MPGASPQSHDASGCVQYSVRECMGVVSWAAFLKPSPNHLPSYHVQFNASSPQMRETTCMSRST